MSFEKVKPNSSSGGSPKISLRKSGGFGINNATLEEYFPEDAEGVVIYYDEENNKVAFEPSDENGDEAYALSRTDSGGSVTALSFINRYQLEPEITTQYAPEENDDGLIVIDLDDPIGTYGSPKEDESDDEAEAVEA